MIKNYNCFDYKKYYLYKLFELKFIILKFRKIKTFGNKILNMIENI